MGEHDLEERKRSKEEKVLLMTSLREFMINEGATAVCAKLRDALRFVRFMLEQISVPALNTCAKMLREGSELAKTLGYSGAVGSSSEQATESIRASHSSQVKNIKNKKYCQSASQTGT